MSGGQSLLHIAASGGDVARIRNLLTTPRSTGLSTATAASSGAHILPQTVSNSNNGAITANSTAVVVVDVNELDSAGCTPLQRAAAEGHDEVMRVLLAHGADVNHKDSVHGNTALHEAAWKGYSRAVALLTAAGAQLSVPNNGGFAALHLCCQNGHNQSCRELLLAACDPDIQNNYGDTPLHTSARYGHAGVTRILISAQCHVSDQNKNGDTALHIAAAMGRRKLTRILLEAGCNKHLRNKQSETAKDIATRKDLNEIIHIINTTKPLKKKTGGGGGDKSVIKQSTSKDKRKSKVRFEATGGKHWSPYGCHYYPDPKSFPKPKLDSLPDEPLRKGEQYYLDLAGNIRKGPIGVGYTCYCAPFFRHMEERLDRDKQELKAHIDKAHERLDHKVANLERRTQGQISELTRCVAAERALCDKRHQHLEQWLLRTQIGRQSERIRKTEHNSPLLQQQQQSNDLYRSKSLELLDELNASTNFTPNQSRSMELLDDSNTNDGDNILADYFQFKSEVMKETTAVNRHRHRHLVQVDLHQTPSRKSVSEMVADIQKQTELKSNDSSIYSNSVVNNRTELHIPILSPISVELQRLNCNNNDNSESSDGDDVVNNQMPPPTLTTNYENINENFYTNEQQQQQQQPNSSQNYSNAPRSRSVLYSPNNSLSTIVPDTLAKPQHIHVQHPYEHHLKNTGLYVLDDVQNTQPSALYDQQRTRKPIDLQLLEKDVHNRIATLHLMDRDVKKDLNTIEHNDSGYSTKVYGSSQGNSPSLSGDVETINNKHLHANNNNATTTNIRNNATIGTSSLV